MTIGAKKIEEWWGQNVGWITHVNVEVKNDGKSRLGEESKEPGVIKGLWLLCWYSLFSFPGSLVLGEAVF